jgi:hypothetical protein
MTGASPSDCTPGLGPNRDHILAREGWETTCERDDYSPIWKDSGGGTQVARAVCWPRPDTEDETIAELIRLYGPWQVAFGSSSAEPEGKRLTGLRVGVDHDALTGEGEHVRLTLTDPAGMIAERVRRVMGEAELLCRREGVPHVVTLAEVLRGNLDHLDRPRQIAQALDLKPWHRVQNTLYE